MTNYGIVKREGLTCLFAFSYQELMKESSRMPLFDLKKLNSSLPVPSVQKSSIEVLVLGAKNDFIVVIMPSSFTYFIVLSCVKIDDISPCHIAAHSYNCLCHFFFLLMPVVFLDFSHFFRNLI